MWRMAFAMVLMSFGVATNALGGCTTMKNAAAQDPQKCERDPKCTHKSDKSRDCITSCVDNIDCISRCDQVNEQNR